MNDTKINEAAKFMKRQVVIEAMQFDGSIASASEICQWANAGDEAAGHDDPTVSYITRGGDDTAHDMVIWTLEGDMTASNGDWIIKGVKGEFYPCKPEIFEMTYTSHLHPQPAELAEQQVGEVQGDARAQFETWAQSEGLALERNKLDDDYLFGETYDAWTVWQAALAAHQPGGNV